MAQRQRVPAGFKPTTKLTVAGIVSRQGICIYSPLRKGDLCRVTLEVGDEDIECVAFGEIASDLAAVITGSPVTIEGAFRFHDGICEVVVDSIETE